MGYQQRCSDQTAVQYLLNIHAINDARAGSFFAGVLKILPDPEILIG
jgi:hypothetical protein